MLKNLLLSAITATFITSLAQGTLSNGLLAYYPFNGNAIDESGNGKNATVTAAVLSPDRFGNANKSFSFNGTNAVILTPINSITTGKMSFCAWVKTPGDASKDFMGIVFARAGYNMATGLGLQQNTSSYFIVNSGSSNVLYENKYIQQDLFNNQWHFMAGTYDGATLKVYLDGVLIKEIVAKIVAPQVNAYFKIGHDDISGYSRYFKGSIDDVRIYDRALSATEILQLNNETACDQTSSERDILVIKTVVTNIDNTSYQNHIRVYPNPVTDNQLTIDYGNYALLNGYKVHVTNSIGVKVFENFVTQAKSEIDLSSWTGSGIYFLSLTDDKGNVLQVRKIILQ